MNLICLALQPATEDDLPFLLTLRKATMTEHLDRAGVPQDDEHHLARIRHHFSDAQIVWFHGRPAGLFKAHRDPAGWRLVQIQIDPAFQGQGLGRRLLAGLLEQADAEGAPVTLSVLDGNPRAGSTRRWASRPRKPGARKSRCATRPERRARPGHIRGPLGGVNRAGPDFSGRGISKERAASIPGSPQPNSFREAHHAQTHRSPAGPGRRRPVLGRRPGPARQAKDGVLVNEAGMTLYTFDKDAGGKSACNDQCAKIWPPVMAAADAKASGDLTIITRDDGGKQWAYKGKPVYLYSKDAKAGDKSGDNFKDVWHAAKP